MDGSATPTIDVLTTAGLDKHSQALRTYCDVLARTLPPELITRFE